MKEIFIERQRSNNLLRIAIKENSKIIECYIEEDTKEPLPGEIYKGVVKNIVPAIKCAFIDIGHEKNAYMYMDKLQLKKGEEVLVEVVKEKIDKKGAKVNNHVTLPGRYVVLTNQNNALDFSQKIERKEVIDYISAEIKKPEDIGIMIRTNAQGADIIIINKEIEELYAIYKEIYNKWLYSIKPKMLFGEGSIVFKILRDSLTEDTEKVVVDNKEDYDLVTDFIKRKVTEPIKVELYEGYRNLFDFYAIEKEILSLRNRKVYLHCGGNISIDRTEAMYVIDVNSGKNVGGRSMEKTVYTTNIEAAEEIAKQIRLRNLSGIIVIDFIDTYSETQKKQIVDTLKAGFQGDKNKTLVYPFTDLNLVQIARKRRGKPISEYIEESCQQCKGAGKRLKLSYLSVLIRNEILKVDGENTVKDIYIEANSIYKTFIEQDIVKFIQSIEALGKNVYLNYSNTVEYFKVDPLIFHSQIENLKDFKIWPFDN